MNTRGQFVIIDFIISRKANQSLIASKQPLSMSNRITAVTSFLILSLKWNKNAYKTIQVSLLILWRLEILMFLHLCWPMKVSLNCQIPLSVKILISMKFIIFLITHPLSHVQFINCLLLVIHGTWANWGSWGSCGSNCRKARVRTCTNPAPRNGGSSCSGSGQETDRCIGDSCK